MQKQALFSSKDKSKKLKCLLLQLLCGALKVKYSKLLGVKVNIVLSMVKTSKHKLHGPSMLVVKAKIYGFLYNNPALSLLMKHLVIGQR